MQNKYDYPLKHTEREATPGSNLALAGWRWERRSLVERVAGVIHHSGVFKRDENVHKRNEQERASL